jgi:dipeptidyl-peptidase-4
MALLAGERASGAVSLAAVRKIAIDDIARLPRPGTVVPESLSFSPDGKTLTYLAPPEGARGGMARVLWAHDVATGAQRVLFAPAGEGVTEATVSLEEALRRERSRQLTQGVTSYEWAKNAPVILVPLLGELWIIQGDAARRVGVRATDPHLSPDGARIAFVRDDELYVLDVATGDEHRLTFDAEVGLTNGLAEYIAQEELARERGFWWSPDATMIAFEQADERHIPPFVIPHWGSDRPEIEEHRYPFAGEANVRARLGVSPASGGPVTWLGLGDIGDRPVEYLARVDWHPDGRLFVQLLDRAQRRLELRAYDTSSGKGETILAEESPFWVNLHDDLRFIGDGGEFLWSSEVTGMRRLELRARDGDLVRPLTDGTWPVDAVAEVDDEGRRVAFTGSPNPLESHVFVVGLDGGEPQRVDVGDGFTVAAFSRGLEHRVEIHQSRTTPPTVTLHDPDRTLHAPEAPDLELVTPELFSFENRDGVVLHGALFRPARLPAPLIVWVYGGPHAQVVQDSWALTADMQAQYLASQGFAVMRVDNRGSARRGLAFEAAIARRLGTDEIDDQVDGVRFAASQGWVDADRVGITGWSYGGFMTLMCMLKAPDVFRVGVAGAPVSSWDGYDTAYAERYLGMPQDNPEGYREGSATAHAAALRGNLLIVHGMLDENVHFRHTARFLEKLAKTRTACDLLLYPSGRHGLRSEEDRRNMHERIAGYFADHL